MLPAGRAADLEGADIEIPMVVNGQPQYRLVLQASGGCSLRVLKGCMRRAVLAVLTPPTCSPAPVQEGINKYGAPGTTVPRVLKLRAALAWHGAFPFPCSNPTRPTPARAVFGEGLNPLEQEWLAEVINDHIGAPCWRCWHLLARRPMAHAWPMPPTPSWRLPRAGQPAGQTSWLAPLTSHLVSFPHSSSTAEENKGRMRELEGFVESGPTDRALPAAGASSSGGQRFSDFVLNSEQQAEMAAEAARVAGRQAEQAGRAAGTAAQRAAARAERDAQRAAGRYGGSKWEEKKRQAPQRWTDNDDDEDDLWNRFR